MSETNLLDELIPEMVSNGERQPPEVSPLSGGQVTGLTEQLNSFEKSILEHALSQHKTTRKMAVFLKTSQSRITRMLKKHQLSTRS
jgi:transcriptional regulator of aromatic amino acid metabolism